MNYNEMQISIDSIFEYILYQLSNITKYRIVSILKWSANSFIHFVYSNQEIRRLKKKEDKEKQKISCKNGGQSELKFSSVIKKQK